MRVLTLLFAQFAFVFGVFSQQSLDQSSVNKEKSKPVRLRVSFNFNLEFNKAYSNLESTHESPGFSSSDDYSKFYPIPDAKNNLPGFNTGINFLYGKRKTSIFFSCNYTLSQSKLVEVTWTKQRDGNGQVITNTETHKTISSYYHFLNFNLGPHFTLFKRVSLEFGPCLQLPILANNTSFGYTDVYTPSSYTRTEFKDLKDQTNRLHSHSISFVNVGFDFKAFGTNFGLFASAKFKLVNDIYNTNSFLYGIRYYPFKKHDSKFNAQLDWI